MTEQPYVARFSPGPWSASQTYPPGDWCIHARGNPWQLAYLRAHPKNEWPLEENARLIAAAPELHDALEPFAGVDGEGSADFPDDTKVVVTFGRTTNYTLTLGDFRRARAAIVKAAPHTVAERQTDTPNTDPSPNQAAATEQPELTEKRVGARRKRKASAFKSRPQVIAPPVPIIVTPDWRDRFADHPASLATLRARLDMAWFAWWREIVARNGGRSFL